MSKKRRQNTGNHPDPMAEIGFAPSESLYAQALALENIGAGDRVDILMDEKGHFKLRKAVAR